MIIRARRLALWFEYAAICAEVAALDASQWRAHFNTSYHDGGWSGVAMRAHDGNAASLYGHPLTPGDAIDTPLLAGCPSISAALAALTCPVRSVRLLRLAADSTIREHRDAGVRFEEGEARLHIPITTNADVDFIVDGQRIVMQAGECWYVNVDLPHRVHNRGLTERIHLVVDCVVNPWLLELFARGWTPEFHLPAGATQFAAFRTAVLDDADLQATLQIVATPAAFAAQCVALGANRGFHFDGEDVRAAMRTGRTAWLQRKMIVRQ